MQPAPASEETSWRAPDPRAARVALLLLFLAYALNFADRTIIGAIGQAIKDDLKISDLQLGLLGGLYFALLYTFLGLPVARFAERFSRTKIIGAAIFVWSGFTALCGLAGSYATLAAFRFGVGVGEAGLSPPAHSLISDYFPRHKRAFALSLYSLGVPAGTLLGAAVGGWLAYTWSWRVAFVALGLPGVLLAYAVHRWVAEPRRGGADPLAAGNAHKPLPAMTIRGELGQIFGVFRLMWRQKPLRHMMLGITLVSFSGYGGSQFLQAYWTRAFGLDYAQTGLITGLAGAASQAVGIFLGGWLADRLARNGAPIWYGLLPAIGIATAFPFFVALYTASSWQWAAFWLLFPGAFTMLYMGPTYGVVQNLVPLTSRATATAILFFVLNLFALGLGPPFTGWLIDQLAAHHFSQPDLPGLAAAVGHLFEAGSFQLQCPGGVAPTGASATVDLACRKALALATRQGSILVYMVSLWGALHYLLASRQLAAAFRQPSEAR